MTTIGTTWRVARDNALSFAESLGHDYVGPEHLLFAVLASRNRVTNRFCREFKINADGVRTVLVCKVKRHSPKPGLRCTPTRPLENVYEKAREEAIERGDSVLCAEHLLLALLQIPQDETTIVREVLEKSGVDVDKALAFVREEASRGIVALRDRVYAATDFVD